MMKIMNENTSQKIITMLLMFVSLMIASTIQATTLRPANFVEVVEKSGTSFHGIVSSVVEQESKLGPAELITVEITEAISGLDEKQKSVSWLQFKGGKKFRIPGMPVFQKGQEVIIFLSESSETSELQAPLALGHGVFRIAKDESTGKSYASNEFNNAALLKDLDVEKLATEVAAQKSAGKTLTEDEKKQVEAKSLKQVQALGSRVVETNDLVDLAKEIKKMKKPSEKFKSEEKSADQPINPVKLYPFLEDK